MPEKDVLSLLYVINSALEMLTGKYEVKLPTKEELDHYDLMIDTLTTHKRFNQVDR